jgi:hypothetical protein
MMSLADRGWTDLTLLTKLLTNPSKSWKRYGCLFLAYAILLHVLGGIISPIQQVYLSTSTVKTPTAPYKIRSLQDTPGKFTRSGDDSNTVALATRKAIEVVSAAEIPSGLWSGSNTTCKFQGKKQEITETLDPACIQPGLSWANMSAIPEPFLSQLPKDFNSGLIRQLAPRFKSTASYENITSAEFPADCASRPGSLSIAYSNITDNGGEAEIWALHACMPADLSMSPWKDTRDRQDFTEELYINVTLNDAMQFRAKELSRNRSLPESEYFRVKVRTTAGYFELPNYMNGEKAGSLLNKIPPDFCGDNCIEQVDSW